MKNEQSYEIGKQGVRKSADFFPRSVDLMRSHIMANQIMFETIREFIYVSEVGDADLKRLSSSEPTLKTDYGISELQQNNIEDT